MRPLDREVGITRALNLWHGFPSAKCYRVTRGNTRFGNTARMPAKCDCHEPDNVTNDGMMFVLGFIVVRFAIDFAIGEFQQQCKRELCLLQR